MKCVSENQNLPTFFVSNLTNMSNFQPLEVVGRGSETQLEMADKLKKLI